MPTPLHEARLDTVQRVLQRSGARSVLDLGCGTGSLLLRLLRDPRFMRITGLDASAEALSVAERELRGAHRHTEGRLSLVHGSFTSRDRRLDGHEAIAMVETIEHVEPGRLSSVESAVFGGYRAGTVVMTTPNVEYNGLLGMPAGALREADHRFEWNRAKFRAWAAGIAKRNGYVVCHSGIGEEHPVLGCPTQMVVFTRAA